MNPPHEFHSTTRAKRGDSLVSRSAQSRVALSRQLISERARGICARTGVRPGSSRATRPRAARCSLLACCRGRVSSPGLRKRHPGRVRRHKSVEFCGQRHEIRWQRSIQQTVTGDLLQEGHRVANPQTPLKEHQRPLQPPLQEWAWEVGLRPSRTQKAACGCVSSHWHDGIAARVCLVSQLARVRGRERSPTASRRGIGPRCAGYRSQQCPSSAGQIRLRAVLRRGRREPASRPRSRRFRTMPVLTCDGVLSATMTRGCSFKKRNYFVKFGFSQPNHTQLPDQSPRG